VNETVEELEGKLEIMTARAGRTESAIRSARAALEDFPSAVFSIPEGATAVRRTVIYTGGGGARKTRHEVGAASILEELDRLCAENKSLNAKCSELAYSRDDQVRVLRNAIKVFQATFAYRKDIPEHVKAVETARAALLQTESIESKPRELAMQSVLDRVIAACKARGWSLHWTARGAYLHLEASELIEAWRGKGSTVLAEAADVFIVLSSIVAACGISWDDLMRAVDEKLVKIESKTCGAGTDEDIVLAAECDRLADELDRRPGVSWKPTVVELRREAKYLRENKKTETCSTCHDTHKM